MGKVPGSVPSFGTIRGDESIEQLRDEVARLQKNLDFLLRHLSGKNIIANSIQAEKLSVTELSAITADMGKITAGEIYGAYIATADGTYPRVELSSTDKLFKAAKASDNYVEIVPGITGEPNLHFKNGTIDATISLSTLFGGSLGVSSSTDVVVTVGSGKNLQVPGWSQLYSTADSQSLATALAAKAAKSVATSSHTQGNHNHGIPDGTVLMVNGGGTVTFSASGGFTHSHTQN